MVVAISNVIAAIAGIGLIGWLIWLAASGDGDREAEDAARDFLDRHGYWPDEAPGHEDGGRDPAAARD
jgi:hypothetical protein